MGRVLKVIKDMTRKSKHQYIISDKIIKNTCMMSMELDSGILYYSSDLSIKKEIDTLGREYILLGNSFCTDLYLKQPIDDIKSFEGDSLLELSKNWTGRWVLICENELITDASGLMSAFYYKCDNGWFISSSLAVIANVLNIQHSEEVTDKGLNWHLLPGTILPGVNVLMCTQKLILSSESLKVISQNRFTDYRGLTSDEKIINVTERLIVGLKNIERFSERKVLLALTAGKDSRLVLAAALTAKINFSAYTMEHPKMIRADKSLPKKFADRFKFSWAFIKRKDKLQKLEKDYLEFNGGNSKGADLIFYSTQQHKQLPKDAIVIRSGLFEAGQSYGRRTMGDTRDSFKDGIFKYYEQSLKLTHQRESFNRWFQNEKDHPIEHLDIRDRFYIEQRVNGWAAAIEQAISINDFLSIQIANCQELLSVLLSASSEERKDDQLAYMMIKALKPELFYYPVNKKTIFDKIGIYKRAIIKRVFK